MSIALSPIFVVDSEIILGNNLGASSKIANKYDKN